MIQTHVAPRLGKAAHVGVNKVTSQYITDWKGFDEFWNLAYQPGKSYTERYGELDKQISTAKSLLVSEDTLKHAKSVDFAFDTTDARVHAKLLAEIPAIWNKLLDTIDLDDNWMVFYNYEDVWRSRKLDEVNREYFKDQIAEDFQGPTNIPGTIDIQLKEKNYDFLPVSIRQLKALRFVNTSKFNTGQAKITNNGSIVENKTVVYWEDSFPYRMIEMAKNSGQTPSAEEIEKTKRDWFKGRQEEGLTPRTKNTRKKKQGSFWKWTLNFPLNLERYMIFNKIDDRTIKLMEADNCLIYACKQFGLPPDIIDHMKDIIHTKSFTMSKLKEISKDVNIGFYIEEGKNGLHHKIGNQDGIVVPLLLMNDHYMLNERVKIAPYYIKHYYEILQDSLAMKKPQNERQLICKRRCIHNKMYYVTEYTDYPLKLVLKTLFKYNCFEPIKMGDYYTYASTLYKYKLDPIDNLDYNPKYCTRKKAPLVLQVRKT